MSNFFFLVAEAEEAKGVGAEAVFFFGKEACWQLGIRSQVLSQ